MLKMYSGTIVVGGYGDDDDLAFALDSLKSRQWAQVKLFGCKYYIFDGVEIISVFHVILTAIQEKIQQPGQLPTQSKMCFVYTKPSCMIVWLSQQLSGECILNIASRLCFSEFLANVDLDNRRFESIPKITS